MRRSPSRSSWLMTGRTTPRHQQRPRSRATFPRKQFGGCKTTKKPGQGRRRQGGVLRSRGAYVLADADGATDIRDHARLEARALAGDCAVVCGSRAHLVDTAVVARRSMIRNILMRGSTRSCRSGGVEGGRDTPVRLQTVSEEGGAGAVQALHLERWAFDVDFICCFRVAVSAAEGSSDVDRGARFQNRFRVRTRCAWRGTSRACASRIWGALAAAPASLTLVCSIPVPRRWRALFVAASHDGTPAASCRASSPACSSTVTGDILDC